MAFRYLGYGFGFLPGEGRLETNPTFDVVVSIADLEWWAAGFMFMGVLAVGGVLIPHYVRFKHLVIFSSGVSVCYAVALLLSATWSPAVFAWASFALVDIIVASMPPLMSRVTR